LPPEKKEVYAAIQAAHIHGSPDGPWFFIIARSLPDQDILQLLGITDTSMLRPQVFALQEGQVQIGLVASEKQAIDATLASLAQEDKRVCPKADRYWNARGGSHTDGGAFIFSLQPPSNGHRTLVCTDKFDDVVSTPQGQRHRNPVSFNPLALSEKALGPLQEEMAEASAAYIETGDRWGLFNYVSGRMREWEYSDLSRFCRWMVRWAERGDDEKAFAIETLTALHDRRYDTGNMRRSWVLAILEEGLETILRATPSISANSSTRYQLINWHTTGSLSGPQDQEQTLIIDVSGFPPEGEDSASRMIVDAYQLGWQRFITYGWRGQRFCGCGLGPDSSGVRIDVYGNPGDYLGSGLDGAQIFVHGDGQDQLGQILKKGKLVVFGDVGQTFMYGAKGGEVYVLGNAAGRPLINAVGRPRVVINGTCLDYLAESFMAGDPLDGGGFVILNGIAFDERGKVREQETPYPGGNLFSLASGGAIYIRDPHRLVSEDQLNGGHFAPLTAADWDLLFPYLKENEQLFGISVEEDLLTVQDIKKSPEELYRKVEAIRLGVLT
jgi:glutamate synthase domain-containing protein 3